MSTFTFRQLSAGITIEDAEAELLAFVQDQGIQTTDWKDGSPELTMLKLMSLVYSELANRCAENSLNALNQYAADNALTELADSYYDNQRTSAESTVGQIIVSGSQSSMPLSFQPTELAVTDGDYIFYNSGSISLTALNPVVTASFVAELPGAEYNISNNSTLTTVNSITGIAITNPAAPSSTTWITTLGKDAESDRTLRQRNTAKWTTLQTSELTVDRVKAIALAASPELTYVSIDDISPRGAGTVDVYCSRDTVPVIQADIDLVQNVLNQAFFNNSTGARVTAIGATAKYYDRALTVYYTSDSNLADVTTRVTTAIDDWIATIPIGGNNYTSALINIASLNDLVRDLESLDGVRKVVFADTTDISFTKAEKLLTPAAGYSSLITYTALAYGF